MVHEYIESMQPLLPLPIYQRYCEFSLHDSVLDLDHKALVVLLESGPYILYVLGLEAK